MEYDKLLKIGRDLLVAIGEDPDRPGLVDTPRRFARYWKEFIEYEPGNTNTAFSNIVTDQMVIVKDIPVWSFCEHHLLPFMCNISVGYIAEDIVLGLSKFARIAQQFAHRLQIQERLVHQIANEITQITGSKDVAVIATGMHTCMIMRGIKSDGVMITSVMRGRFRELNETRNEFLRLLS